MHNLLYPYLVAIGVVAIIAVTWCALRRIATPGLRTALCVLLFGLGVLAIPFAAFAQTSAPDGVVVVPWGTWLAGWLSSAGSVAAAVLAAVVAKWAPALVKGFLTEKVINDAVNYGLGAIEGAVAGKELDLKTTNAVLTAAADYAVSVEPAVSSWIGGNLRSLLLSRLSALGSVPASATAASTGAAPK